MLLPFPLLLPFFSFSFPRNALPTLIMFKNNLTIRRTRKKREIQKRVGTSITTTSVKKIIIILPISYNPFFIPPRSPTNRMLGQKYRKQRPTFPILSFSFFPSHPAPDRKKNYNFFSCQKVFVKTPCRPNVRTKIQEPKEAFFSHTFFFVISLPFCP